VIRAAAVSVALLAAAGCGVRPTGVVYAGDGPVATASPSPGSMVFFLADGVPTAVERTASPSDPQAVYDALLAGPTPEERARGLRTELVGVRRITVVDGGGRPVLLRTEPPIPKLSAGAYAQIYCTGMVLPRQVIIKFAYPVGGSPLIEKTGCGGALPGAGAPPARG
jgi:hypothetical protein